MSALPDSFGFTPTRVTPDAYLAQEREATEKHEYYFGEVYAMAGGTPNHSRVIVNLNREVSLALKGSPCEAFSSETKVRSGDLGLYSYPDLTVVCGKAEFSDDKGDVLLNPIAIFEVLSPTTEAFDRGNKFRAYRTIPSLQEYILVDQTKPLVEVYRREETGWLLTTFEDLNGSAILTATGITLALSEIYDHVEWPSAESQATTSEPTA